MPFSFVIMNREGWEFESAGRRVPAASLGRSSGKVASKSAPRRASFATEPVKAGRIFTTEMAEGTRGVWPFSTVEIKEKPAPSDRSD